MSPASNCDTARVRNVPPRTVALRYSVRIDQPECGVREIGKGLDLDSLIDYAKRQHDETGLKTWVVDTKTGRRLWRSDATMPPSRAAGERSGL